MLDAFPAAAMTDMDHPGNRQALPHLKSPGSGLTEETAFA
jgi:hypothetical protein